MTTWMGRFRSGSARMWWAGMTPTASHWRPGLRFALNAPPDGVAGLRYGRAANGKLIPDRTTNVLIKPDNYES